MKSIDSICLQNGDAKKKKKRKNQQLKACMLYIGTICPENQDRRGEIGATYEIETHKLVNTERRKAGLVELQYDDALAQIAEKHSIDMSPAGRHFYDDEDRVNPIYRDYPYPNHHANPDGLRVYDRHRKAGYSGYI